MIVSYKLDNIHQLSCVKEILINEGTIGFYVYHYHSKHFVELDLQDFFIESEGKKINVFVTRTDGRVEDWIKLEELSLFENIEDSVVYHLGSAVIEKKNIISLYIREDY